MKHSLFLFGAGSLAGLLQALLMWQCGSMGISHTFHVAIAPALTTAWLYKKVVLGGLWALLFLLPMQDSRYLFKGLVISLFPAIVQLFVIYPYFTAYGLAGLNLGLLTPLYIVSMYAIWGVLTALLIRLSK